MLHSLKQLKQCIQHIQLLMNHQQISSKLVLPIGNKNFKNRIAMAQHTRVLPLVCHQYNSPLFTLMHQSMVANGNTPMIQFNYLTVQLHLTDNDNHPWNETNYTFDTGQRAHNPNFFIIDINYIATRLQLWAHKPFVKYIPGHVL